jgi:hypothetical protein
MGLWRALLARPEEGVRAYMVCSVDKLSVFHL